MKIRRALNFLFYDRRYFYNLLGQIFRQKVSQKYGQAKGKSFFLKTLWIPLTYRCNLSCKMCGQWGRTGRSKGLEKEILQEDLTLSLLKGLIDEVKKYSPKIILVGGEPFLYNNWYELARYVRENNLRCEITTNGILLSEVSEKAASVFDCLNISLDGDRETNDNIRGIKGGFDMVLEGIKKVLEVRKSSKPFINICCTIGEENFSNLEKLVEEIENRKIKIDTLLFQHLEFIDEEILNKTSKMWREKFNQDADYWRGICRKTQKVNPEILSYQISKIKKIKAKNIKFIMFEPNFTEDELKNYYLSPQNVKRFQRVCLAPQGEAFVYPEGNVWTCPGLIMGNIKEDKFIDIWNNSKYILLRKTLREIKTFPVCTRCANHWHN